MTENDLLNNIDKNGLVGNSWGNAAFLPNEKDLTSQITESSCPSMLGFVKSFCGISDFFLKILSFQSKFPLTHALMSCKAIYF